jgi:hypothetical protein
VPSPVFNFLVSVSIPNSPAASVGLLDVQFAAVSRRCCILDVIVFLFAFG